jgi:putative transposase
MGHTYTKLLAHLVFSTKERVPMLTPELRPRIFPYLSGIIRELDATALLVNGPADHVHVLARYPAKLSLSELVGKVKANSSGWVHREFQALWNFAWQTGYSAFSVSQSAQQAVLDYIARQEEHHRNVSFQDELRALLRKHEIEFDERYLWE